MPRQWKSRAPQPRRGNAEWPVMVGALSIVTFWAFGLGIFLGAAAVAGAMWSSRGSKPSDDPEQTADRLTAIAVGTTGVIAGTGFLILVLPV